MQDAVPEKATKGATRWGREFVYCQQIVDHEVRLNVMRCDGGRGPKQRMNN